MKTALAAFALLLAPTLAWAQAGPFQGGYPGPSAPASTGSGAAPSGSSGDIQTYSTSTTFGHITPGSGVAAALANAAGGTGGFALQQTFSCADLSNGATGCSTATGTSGATIPLLNGTNTFSGSQTFGEAHGTTYTPTLTSNNYNAAATDCGKILLFPTGTTPTLTLPNLNAACTINVIQNSAVQFTPQAASGGTLQANVNSFTKSKALGAFLTFTIIVPSASAATWAWTGDGA